MVERYRRGKNKKKLLGNHQKCWIWGRNTVLETLNVGRWPIVELLISAALPSGEIQSAEARAAELNVPVQLDTSEGLMKLCQSKEHQGYLAKMTEYPYVEAADVLEDMSPSPLVGILDSIQDPHNFGAMIRSACIMGADALFVARRNQVEVTSRVARSSAGAVNHIPIVRVDELVATLDAFRDRGLRIVAATQDAETTFDNYDLIQPVAVVIGNEGIGIRNEVVAACDDCARIPQTGSFDSLNAAVAAGIVFYEAQRQRASH